MRLFVQLFFSGAGKFLAPILAIVLVLSCSSGGAELLDEHRPRLSGGWGGTFPSDMLFKRDLSAAGNRLPDAGHSAGPHLLLAAQSDPYVIDGFSPRTPIYVSLPCDLREDRIPDRGPFEGLHLLDISRGHSVPFYVRYRNRERCGLALQPMHPLDMDHVYAVFVMASSVWQGRVAESRELRDVLDECARSGDPSSETERRSGLFGLRPREARQAVEALRQQGMSTSQVLRAGVFAVRSRGGLYGPFFAIQQRYALAGPPVVRRSEVTRLPDGVLLTLRMIVRDVCEKDPCRIVPVSGPGILAAPRSAGERDRELTVLLRVPGGQRSRVVWVEGPERTAEENARFFALPLLGRLARDVGAILAMVPARPGLTVEERTASLIHKMAFSRYLSAASSPGSWIDVCAGQGGCSGPIHPDDARTGMGQLCLRQGDCYASAVLDPYVEQVVVPNRETSWMTRHPFADGALPARDIILREMVRDLREDLFSPDLLAKWAESGSFRRLARETHVTKNIFSPQQYDELVEFMRRSKSSSAVGPL